MLKIGLPAGRQGNYMLSKLRDFIWSLPLNRNVLTIVGLFVILAAIPLTVYLSQQQQELRQRAEKNNCIQKCGLEFAAREPECNAILENCDADSVYNSCRERVRGECERDCGDANVDCPGACEQDKLRVCNSERENRQNECNNAYNDCKSKSRATYDSCVQNCSAPPPEVKCTDTNGNPRNPGDRMYICKNEGCPDYAAGFGIPLICNNNGDWDYGIEGGGAECTDQCEAPPEPPTPTVGSPPGGGPPPTPAPGSIGGGPTQCDDSGRGFAAGGRNSGDKRYKCVTGACPYDSNIGLGIPYVCESDGSWSERNSGYPECTVNGECAPTGGGQPTPTTPPGQPTATRAPAPTRSQTAPTPTRTTSQPTPTPTRAPIPTATPIPPTPTIPAGATALAVNVRQQVLASPPRNNSRQLEVKIFNNRNQEIKSENANAPFQNGVFTGTLNLGNNFATGPYVVKVKIANTLRKLMQNVTNITAGQTNTLAAVELISGDLNNDNELSAVDYANLIGCVELPGKPVICINRSAADLNDDGKVTIQDLGILISNFSRRQGD